MTRANFVIIVPQGKFKFQGNSSCYPTNIMGNVINFALSTASSNLGASNGFYTEPSSNDIATFIENVGLTLGQVGNPTYYYEIDFINQKVSVWDYAMRWVNAPSDWKERGWNCWQGKNGKFGWTNFVKGKKIYNKSFSEIFINKDVAILEAEQI